MQLSLIPPHIFLGGTSYLYAMDTVCIFKPATDKVGSMKLALSNQKGMNT